MSLLINYSDKDKILGIWKMSESLLEIEHHPYAYSFISESKQFKSEKRIKEWLTVRILLHTLLGVEKEIAYYSTGRPYLIDHSYHLSISHTSGYVAILLSEHFEVGIDIEAYSTRVHRLAPRVFSSEEFFYSKEETIYELLIWSAKEVLFKLIDQSNLDFKKHFKIYPFHISNQGFFLAQEFKTESCNFYTINYQHTFEYILTYALKKKCPDELTSAGHSK